MGICLAEMISYSKEVINGWDHLMHAIELGSEVAQSLFSHLEVEVYNRSKQKGNFVVKLVALQQTYTE